MDSDENDLISTNIYIQKPELDTELTNESNEEFRKYYKDQMTKITDAKMKENFEKMSIRSIQLEEDSDATNLLNTNKFDINTSDINKVSDNKGGVINVKDVKRFQKDIVTYVSIDSRNRDMSIYPKPSEFKIFLGKTFYNVKSIKLIRVEFPNTDAVINSSNNKIYWRNQEDIDKNVINNATNKYPVYNANLRIGSYISTSLQSEISDKMSSIKRQNLLSNDYHYFQIDLDIDTDIVTFTSLTVTPLKNNPFTTVTNSSIINVETTYAHGLNSGDIVYIIGAKNVSGIPASSINTSHVVSLPSSTGVDNTKIFQIEVNVKAGESGTGGGNTVSFGSLAPFQLLFGENSNTIAPNLGFPLENSGERIVTYIKKIEKVYLVKIITQDLHNLINDDLGKICTVNVSSLIGNDVNFNKDYPIAKIIDNKTFLIDVGSLPLSSSYNTGNIIYNASIFNIAYVGNDSSDIILVTTYTDHNFQISDIDIATVTFTNVPTTPELNGEYKLYGLLPLYTLNGTTGVVTQTNLKFYAQANILLGGGKTSSTIGDVGSIPRHDPLRTKTIRLLNMSQLLTTTKFTCSETHGLSTGDYVKFYNIKTIPSILDINNGIHIVTVLSNTEFSIMLTINADPDEVMTVGNISTFKNNNIYIGTNLVTMSFPNHRFNQILEIKNYTDIQYLTINTKDFHGLLTGDTIRIFGTTLSNTLVYTVVQKIDADTISIQTNQTTPLLLPGFEYPLCKSSLVKAIDNITKDKKYIKITSINHGLSDLSSIYIISSTSTTNITNESVPYTNVVKLSSSELLIPFEDSFINAPTGSAFTGVFGIASSIFDIDTLSYVDNTVTITTNINHNLITGDTIRIFGNDSTPSNINISNIAVTVLDLTSFTIQFPGGVDITSTITNGKFGKTSAFKNITTITNNNDISYVNVNLTNHGFITGDSIKIVDSGTTPSIDNSTGYTIITKGSNDFIIPMSTTISFIGSTSMGFASLQTNFKLIDSIITDQKLIVKTKLPHNLQTDDNIIISGTENDTVNGKYQVKVIDNDEFIISGSVTNPIINKGVPMLSNEFYLYGSSTFSGISTKALNNIKHYVKEVIDENTFTFEISEYGNDTIYGGGKQMYISSLLHGFSGVQNNTKNSLLNRSINLEGENYVFLCCPQLSTMMNTGDVKDIFARITLDQSPGNMVFNFLSNPKIFDTVPLNKLEELDFSVVYYNNNFYEFNDLDYSFVLEITEEIDTTDNFGFSSRRGISTL